MDSASEYWSAKAALDWQIEMGVDEAIADAPVDRYAIEVKKPAATPPVAAPPPAAPVEAAPVDAVQVARDAAASAADLDGLQAALFAFEECDLKAAARNFIFADGVPGSKVMVITDPPNRDDDRAGQMMSGRGGVLFDKMIAAIGLSRVGDNTVYMAPVLPWNPPQNRDPSGAELAMMTPFLRRHIELAQPRLLVLMGNAPCQALLGRNGMTRLRGTWVDVAGTPALPMFTPDYLMAHGAAKRDTWADLLDLKARLKDIT